MIKYIISLFLLLSIIGCTTNQNVENNKKEDTVKTIDFKPLSNTEIQEKEKKSEEAAKKLEEILKKSEEEIKKQKEEMKNEI